MTNRTALVPALVPALVAVLCAACVPEDPAAETDPSSTGDATAEDPSSSTDDAETDESADSEDSDTGDPLPDVGPAPDEHCPNPGPWPLPEPPSVDLPQFVDHSYIDLDQIGWVTKFRSSVGHDYSDDFEHCRSMKHYFYPLDEVDPEAVEIYAPVDGVVLFIDDEWQGQRIVIQSTDYPEIEFMLFHVDIEGPLAPGAEVVAGELLGTHSFGGVVFYSDVAVWYWEDVETYRLVSYIDVLTDAAFDAYVARGEVASRDELMITREQRDDMALCCTDGQFDADEDLSDWIALDPMPSAPPTIEILPASEDAVDQLLRAHGR